MAEGEAGGQGAERRHHAEYKNYKFPLAQKKVNRVISKIKKKKDIAVRSTSIEIQKKYKK